MFRSRIACLTGLLIFILYFSVEASAQAAAPTFSVAAGTYQDPQSVTITDATAGASIYYTVTGVAPTTLSTEYTGPVTVSKSMTLRAIAAVSGGTASAITTAA